MIWGEATKEKPLCLAKVTASFSNNAGQDKTCEEQGNSFVLITYVLSNAFFYSAYTLSSNRIRDSKWVSNLYEAEESK